MPEWNLIYKRGNNSYRAGQFVIRIDGPLDLEDFPNCLNFTPQLYSLFLHEYLHFIQDVSTRYGIMKESTIYSTISTIANNIRTSSSNAFSVPQHIKRNSLPNVFGNSNLLKYRMGSAFELSKSFRGRKINVTRYIYGYNKASEDKTEPRIILKTEDAVTHQPLQDINFGGEILSEGMAYLAEKSYCDYVGAPVSKGEEYPYLIVTKTVEMLYPEMAENELAIFQCIDACLFYTFSPGFFFVKLVEFLRDNKLIENGWDESYITNFLKDQIEHNFSFEECLQDSYTQISYAFQILPLVDTLEWLKGIYRRAEWLRTYPSFTKCFFINDSVNQNFREKILNGVGTPLVQNDIYNTILYRLSSLRPLDIHPEYFSAAFCLFNVFLNKKECGLKDFCKASRKDNPNIVVDGTCATPWLKLQKNTRAGSQLCPFAVLWKHWGLSNKHPL